MQNESFMEQQGLATTTTTRTTIIIIIMAVVVALLIYFLIKSANFNKGLTAEWEQRTQDRETEGRTQVSMVYH